MEKIGFNFKTVVIILLVIGVCVGAMAEDKSKKRTRYYDEPDWFEDEEMVLEIINKKTGKSYKMWDIHIAFGSSNMINNNDAMSRAKNRALEEFAQMVEVNVESNHFRRLVEEINETGGKLNSSSSDTYEGNIVSKVSALINGSSIAIQQSKKTLQGRAYIALYITKEDLEKSRGLIGDANKK